MELKVVKILMVLILDKGLSTGNVRCHNFRKPQVYQNTIAYQI